MSLKMVNFTILKLTFSMTTSVLHKWVFQMLWAPVLYLKAYAKNNCFDFRTVQFFVQLKQFQRACFFNHSFWKSLNNTDTLKWEYLVVFLHYSPDTLNRNVWDSQNKDFTSHHSPPGTLQRLSMMLFKKINYLNLTYHKSLF